MSVLRTSPFQGLRIAMFGSIYYFGYMEKDLLSEEDIPVEEYPMLLDRVQAIFIDGLLIVTLMFVFASVLDRYENTPDWVRIVLFFGIWAVYEPLFVVFGCTLGQYLKKIRVRRHSDPSRRINIVQAFFRYVFKVFLGWFSFLTINFNPEKRAIHDFISGSVVIKVK
jgi:uncharacterized RDD family membrane protein YckC